MTRLATLALTDCYRATVTVEVVHLEPDQLAITRAGLQRCLEHWPKCSIAAINKALGFRDREIADASRVHILERLNAPPSPVGGSLTASKGSIKRSPKRR